MRKDRKPAFFSGRLGMSAFVRKKRLKNRWTHGPLRNSLVDSIYYGGPSVLKTKDGVKIVASKKIRFDEPHIV